MRRVRRWVVRTATGSIGFGLAVADQVDLVRQAANERFLDLEFATFSIRPVVTDAVDLSDVMPAFVAEYNTPPEVAATIPATLAGSVDALVERLQQHRDELGLSYRIIGGGAMEAFAPLSPIEAQEWRPPPHFAGETDGCADQNQRPH